MEAIFWVQGLSPRVRGNLPEDDEQATQPEVYPRVYGGTTVLPILIRLWKGLSPRVRGNHVTPGHSYTRQGSIPACTGEPW